jgi:hypothetical protein
MALHSGIASSLLCAAQQLVPPLPPAEAGSPPASDADLLAAAKQLVQQHLGLTGLAARTAAALLASRAAAGAAQTDRCLQQVVDLVGALSGEGQEAVARCCPWRACCAAQRRALP